MPNVREGGINAVEAAYVVACLPGLVWIVLLGHRVIAQEAMSVRRVELMSLDFLATTVPPALVFAALALTGQASVQGVGRNLFLSLAAAMVVTELFSAQFSFLLPLAYLLLAGTCGFDFAATRPAGWALVLDRWEPGRDEYVMAAATMIVLGVLVGSRLSTRRSRQAQYDAD